MGKTITHDIIICPKCKDSGFSIESALLKCSNCHETYGRSGDKLFFFEYPDDGASNLLDKLKVKMKKYNSLYDFLIFLVSPVCVMNMGVKKFIREYINGKDVVAFNIGAGNTNLHENITNIDLHKYNNVDMTADILNLPVKNDSVDVIMNIAVLEHVSSPEKAVMEFHRILKDGGVVYCYFPFMQGLHASPFDCSRRTLEGMRILFKDWEILEIRDATGPTSGFLWVFQEYFAILFSFGIKPLYSLLHLFIMLVTFPLKFLDILLIRHPMGKNISSGYMVIARKRNRV